jgi:hypothetical protein
LKLVHLLPAVFTIGEVLCIITALFGPIIPLLSVFGLSPLLLFSLIIFVDASMAEHNVGVGIRAVAASFVQLTGYGTGFLRAWWERCVLGRGEFEAFKKNFYK